jgi:hypothetical protein
MKIQFLPQRKHITIAKNNWLMLFKGGGKHYTNYIIMNNGH